MRYDTLRTALDPEAVRKALADAWIIKFGVQPASDSISVLLSQIAQETGWRACWNWNLGYEGCAWAGFLRTGWRLKSVPRSACRASQRRSRYPNFEPSQPSKMGITAYLSVMAKHFASAWPAVLAGDPHEFAVLLSRAEILHSLCRGLQPEALWLISKSYASPHCIRSRRLRSFSADSATRRLTTSQR